MTGLIIDTSGDQGVIALVQEGCLLAAQTLPQGAQLSKYFFPSLQNLLAEQKLELQDLHYIAAGIGPGSYTGTRVGATAAKTLSFALKIPLVSFCSLKAFLSEKKGKQTCLMEAKGESFYLLRALWKEEQITFSFHSLSLSALPSYLEEEETIIMRQAATLKERVPNADKWQWQEPIFNLELLAQITYQKFLKKQYSLDAHLELAYLQQF